MPACIYCKYDVGHSPTCHRSIIRQVSPQREEIHALTAQVEKLVEEKRLDDLHITTLEAENKSLRDTQQELITFVENLRTVAKTGNNLSSGKIAYECDQLLAKARGTKEGK